MTDPVADLLPWDSEFFSLRIGRVHNRRPTSADMKSVVEWMDRESVDCAYLLLDSDATDSVHDVEAAGAHLMDVRVTLRRYLDEPIPQRDRDISQANSSDVAALRAIAAGSHRNTRFYADPRFPAAKCDSLYETWIERSCLEGFAEAVLVARQNGQPTGYVTCDADAQGHGWIGLIAVAESWRGRGLGAALVSEALRWFHKTGLEEVRVITQAANASAMRMYERTGFVTHEVEYWYHLWH